MLNAQSLLERFLGSGRVDQQAQSQQPQAQLSPWLNEAGPGAPGLGTVAREALNSAGGLGGLAASGVAGGLLGLLVGGKKKKKGGGGLGGVVSHGGAALLGALASQAFQSWRNGQPPAQAPAALPQNLPRLEPQFLPAAAPAADGAPFELALIRAMIAAAKCDGQIDAEEQRRIFARVGEADLDAESKAFVFDALAATTGVSDIAALATTPEQAAEIYLASRLAIEPDVPGESAYLEALAHRLKLPTELIAHLDRQADAV
jgi:uncharacterized membrane protein YebE (DUF533 family)